MILTENEMKKKNSLIRAGKSFERIKTLRNFFFFWLVLFLINFALGKLNKVNDSFYTNQINFKLNLSKKSKVHTDNRFSTLAKSIAKIINIIYLFFI